MPNDKDLFDEESQMVSMSFGDHIEELRYRLMLGILGLFVGMILTFIPVPMLGDSIGMYVFHTMEGPAQVTLTEFYKEQATRQAKEARSVEKLSPPVSYQIEAAQFVEQIGKVAPQLKPMLPDKDAEQLKGTKLQLTLQAQAGDLIEANESTFYRSALVSLAPLETITIYFMICLVTGLVLTSPFVFYQAWAFVGAGLYRHERHYVKKFLPFSLGLFLAGVFLCFYGVLPVTLSFLLQFNVWLGIEPTMRITDWISFATILPIVFGICFQTPLIMLFLERVGILTVEDFKSKRKIAIMIMVIAAAILTPGPDVFSQLMLAVPMVGLYELGIIMINSNRSKRVPVA